ncbi:WD40/YVTN/BNR-like repeat-containing protein [Thioalkalivibrio sp.]|uniref:WD40/YVTN/BNR-like repeat-containing protein n=1 Tax=Thioalkalivibrio sp. TaxID=2093813 RepID=UPI00356A0E7C
MNRIIGLIFPLFVLMAVAFAFSERPDPPMPDTRVEIRHLLMLDAVAAGPRLIAVGERGRIFLSDDGGLQWRSAVSDSAATLTAVAAVNPERLVAVGHDSVILLSDDGGEHWRTVFAEPEAEEPLLAVRFDPDGHGYAVGAYGRFLATGDGGLSWEQRHPDGTDFHLGAIARSGGSLLLAGEAGTLMRSNDGGERWHALESPYAGSFFGALELPGGGVLVYGMRGHAFHSPDAGGSWHYVETGTDLSIFGGRVLADGSLLLVGQNGLVLHGRGLERGLAPLDLDTSRTFSAVVESGPAEVLLFGDEGVLSIPREQLGGSGW